MKDFVFVLIRSINAFYMYDTNMNSLIEIDKSLYDVLYKWDKVSDLDAVISEEQRDYYLSLKDQGYLQSRIVEEIYHPMTPYLDVFLKRKLSQLVIQVTQECNFRCEYCSYSGIYEGQRVHSSKQISLTTAKIAVDYAATNCSRCNLLL